ncbi:twin-arginine translocation signal domain-containing protein [Larkinella arboricola]
MESANRSSRREFMKKAAGSGAVAFSATRIFLWKQSS